MGAKEAALRVNCVCASCNNGWMNELDYEAQALFVDAAVIGAPRRLKALSEQKLVARWCAKIALLFAQTQAAPIIEEETHRAVFDGELPDRTMIWLVSTVAPDYVACGLPKTWGLGGPAENAYFVTFGVNSLIAQVLMPKADAPAFEVDRGGNHSIMKQLWPPSLTGLTWPPPMHMRWDEVDKLSNDFQQKPPGVGWGA